MKKLLLILFIGITFSLSALTNKSGNRLELLEQDGHVVIKVYENESDTAKQIAALSTFIGNKLELAKDTAEWVSGKKIKEIEYELLEDVIIQESLNGGILKYNPYIDVALIEELKK